MTDSANISENEEREELLTLLQRSRERYLAVLANISEETAELRLDETSWSILECAEHLAAAEGLMLRSWEKLATPGQTEHAKDQVVRDSAPDRQRKAQAPERARPTGRFSTLAEAREKFLANRQASLEKVRQETGLREKIVEHPLAGTLDGYQLFLLMALHAERHAAQIEEIAARVAARAAGAMDE